VEYSNHSPECSVDMGVLSSGQELLEAMGSGRDLKAKQLQELAGTQRETRMSFND
jgi:hypothetical protein